jgi:hypothetical protein
MRAAYTDIHTRPATKHDKAKQKMAQAQQAFAGIPRDVLAAPVPGKRVAGDGTKVDTPRTVAHWLFGPGKTETRKMLKLAKNQATKVYHQE